MLFYFLMKKCKIIDIQYIRLTMFHISNYHNQLWVLSRVVGVPYLKVSGRPGGSGHDTESPTSSLVLYDELADVNPSHQTMTHIQDLWHCQQREKMCSCILVYCKIFRVLGVNSTSVCLNSLWEIFNWCANKIHIFFFLILVEIWLEFISLNSPVLVKASVQISSRARSLPRLILYITATVVAHIKIIPYIA